MRVSSIGRMMEQVGGMLSGRGTTGGRRAGTQPGGTTRRTRGTGPAPRGSGGGSLGRYARRFLRG